jgi:hypothetical protein
MCLGKCLIAYEIVLRMLGYPNTGLTRSDLMWVDRQDDGAALRLFHSTALASLIVDGEIRPGMDGLFVVLYVFGESTTSYPTCLNVLLQLYLSSGELFDAWLNRTLPHSVRCLNAWRAYFFLMAWRQDIDRLNEQHPLFIGANSSLSAPAWVILERVAVSLILLIETYAQYHPHTALQPWNLTTRSLEHWFGEARRLFRPDFTVSELLFGVRTQDLRSEIFHNGDVRLRGTRERRNKVGYQFNDEPLQKGSPIWRLLSRYPSFEERTIHIPMAAFSQACALLDRLGMPQPITSSAPGALGYDPRPTPTSFGALNVLSDDDADDEDDLSSDDAMNIDNGLPPAAFKSARPSLNVEVKRACKEAVARSLKASRLDYFEHDAEDLLKDLQDGTADELFCPADSYPSNHGEVVIEESESRLDQWLNAESKTLDAAKVVASRRRHDPSTRLNSERAKASTATLPRRSDSNIPTPTEASAYLRERRDVRGQADRGQRVRTKSVRQVRWERRRKEIVQTYTSARDHYIGSFTLSIDLHCH